MPVILKTPPNINLPPAERIYAPQATISVSSPFLTHLSIITAMGTAETPVPRRGGSKNYHAAAAAPLLGGSENYHAAVVPRLGGSENYYHDAQVPSSVERIVSSLLSPLLSLSHWPYPIVFINDCFF